MRWYYGSLEWGGCELNLLLNLITVRGLCFFAFLDRTKQLSIIIKKWQGLWLGSEFEEKNSLEILKHVHTSCSGFESIMWTMWGRNPQLTIKLVSGRCYLWGVRKIQSLSLCRNTTITQATRKVPLKMSSQSKITKQMSKQFTWGWSADTTKGIFTQTLHQ